MNNYFTVLSIKYLHNVILKINKSGNIIWTYDMNSNINYSSRSVVIDGYNNIYYQNDSLYCISKDGVRKWSYATNSGPSVPVLTYDNKLILKSYNGFTQLDSIGNVIWTKSLNIFSNESNIVIDDNDNIYYNYWAGLSVISLDKSGNTRWNLQNITNGLVIPGPALSPLARLITFPKRPARVYSIK